MMKHTKIAAGIAAALLMTSINLQAADALSTESEVVYESGKIAQLLPNDEVQFGGYMRTGGGVNADGQNVNKIDEHHLGRYGNEYDTYIALGLGKRFTMDDGTWAQYSLELNSWDWDANKQDGGVDIDKNFLKMGGFNFMPEDANVWVGTRKQEADWGILDYKWRRLQGTGIGYESKNFDIQFLQKGTGLDTIYTYHGDVAGHTVAARYRLGKLETELMYTSVAEFADEEAQETIAGREFADRAIQLTVNYQMDSFFGLTEGNAKIVAQYGLGKTEDGLGWNAPISEHDDDVAYRFAMDGLFHATESMQVAPVLLFESFEADDWNDAETHLTAGVNVHNMITKHLSIVGEAVISDFNNEGGDANADGIKYKIAMGPSLQLQQGFWGRPVTRLMVTYIHVDEALNGTTDYPGLNDSGDESEFRIGYEFEIWF